MPGFGSGPFGHEPFGEWKWSKRVLYEYIPETYRQQDEDQGGLLETYAESLRPSFDELRHQIQKLEDLRNPLKVRTQYTEVETLKLGPVENPIGTLEQRGSNGRVDALNQFIAPSSRFTSRSLGKEITIQGSVFPQNNDTVVITSVVNTTTVVTDPVLATDSGPLSWELRPAVDLSDEYVTVKVRSGDVSGVRPGWILNDGYADFTVVARSQLPSTDDSPLYLTDREGYDGTINSSGNIVSATIGFTQLDVGKPVSISTSSIPENNNRWEIRELVSSTEAVVTNKSGDAPSETADAFFWAILPHSELVLLGTTAPTGTVEAEGLSGSLSGVTTFENLTYDFVATDVGKILSFRGSTIPTNNVSTVITAVNVGSVEVADTLTVDAGPIAWEMRTPTANVDSSELSVRATSLITRLAYDFGISVDTQESEDRQRSWVANVSQWVQKKGTAEAYEILASISGWDATPIGLYNVSLDSYNTIPTTNTLQIGESGAGRSGTNGTLSLATRVRFSSPTASFVNSDVGTFIRITEATELANEGLYEIYEVIDANTVDMTLQHALTLPEASNGNLVWALVRLYATVPPSRPLFDDFNMDYMEDLIDGYSPQTTNNFGLDLFCWEEGFDTDVNVVIDSVVAVAPGLYKVTTSDGVAQGPSSVIGSAAVVNLAGKWKITDSLGATLYLETDPVELAGTYSFNVASALPLTTGAAILSYDCTTVLKCGYCRSSRLLLQLVAGTILNETGVGIERARDRMLLRLVDVTPAHVDLVIRFVQELEATLTLSASACYVNALLIAPLTANFDEISMDIIVADGTSYSTAYHYTDMEPDIPWTDLALTATVETP